MADISRRRGGRVVAVAVLAAVTAVVLGVLWLAQGRQQAAPPADFGAVPSTAAGAAGGPSGTAPPLPATEQAARTDAAPERVVVPGVGLDARVEGVGVTERGDMTVPDDPAVAGWYRYGAAPGSAEGSAVLVGHLDSETGDLGEFAALRDVGAGDTVEVRRAGAEPVAYRVTARATVPKDELPPSAFRRTGPPVLTLITCAPPFEPERGGYTANLVVTAEPMDTR
ncbi:class F sortase [Streptomyces albogriseolus]|uniref:class F sortase n=1 Tax=Streptomyces albogriseolus TaxID=1887 RepID=UPI003681F522